MKVEVEARIYPSEDSEKVEEAVSNIFPTLDLEVKDQMVKGSSKDPKSLEPLRNKLGLQAIRDSARREIKKGLVENSVRFSLNKQAATVDKISFSTGDTPLGTIDVTIEAKNINQVVDFVAPSKDKR